jgi:hypothetical protein
MWVERHVTTSSDVGALTIARVYRQLGGSTPVHRIETR